MSERFDAPRSGGRAARPGTAGAGSRAGADRETGARGVRQSSGRSDTRRSGLRSNGRGETPGAGSGRNGTASGKPGGPDRVGASRAGRPDRVRGDARTPEADGTAALALEVTDLSVTAGGPLPAGRPRLWVAPPLPIRAPRATFAASVIAVVLVGVLGILLINTKTMEQSFRIDALEKEQARLDKQKQTLEQQLIQASNPGNIHAAARRLGLVMAESPAMIRLPDGKMSRIPTPGRGQPGVTAQTSLNQQAGAASTGAGR